jgi:hypothetical protein
MIIFGKNGTFDKIILDKENYYDILLVSERELSLNKKEHTMKNAKLKILVQEMKSLGFDKFNRLDALVVYNAMKQVDKLSKEPTPVMTEAGKSKLVEMGYEKANKLDTKLIFTKLAA